MRTAIIIVITFLSIIQSIAQTSQNKNTHSLKLLPVYKGEPSELDSTYEKKYHIEKLRFYLSDLIILNEQDSIVYTHQAKNILIDIAKPESLLILFQDSLLVSKMYKMQFGIGVDSTTHARGAMEGDLDPVNDMYWTWQSGYINIKLEGNITHNANKEQFEYHIGGYTGNRNAYRKIRLPYNGNLFIHLDQLLSQMLGKQQHIMSPGKDATDFADIFARCMSHTF